MNSLKKFQSFIVVLFLLLLTVGLNAQPFIRTTGGLGQYGYIERDATPTNFLVGNGGFNNIFQYGVRSWINGSTNNYVYTGSGSCSRGDDATGNYTFGSGTLNNGSTVFSSVFVEYCGPSYSCGSMTPTGACFNERQYHVLDVNNVNPGGSLASTVVQNSNNVVLSFVIDPGGTARTLNRLWIINDGSALEGTDINNDGFKLFYENYTGSESFGGSESNVQLWGDYNGNATNNNTYGNDALGAITVPATGLRCYVVLNSMNASAYCKTVQVSIIADGISLADNPSANNMRLVRMDKTGGASINVNCPTITTGTITGSPFCAGSAVSVPYTISGTFVTGNVFTAQLSSSTGSFASPTNIGTLSSTTAGTINATIPAGASTGTQYRIRVVSGSLITGSNNGVDLSVTSAGTYIGANGGDWNVAGNWCGGVPTSSTDVVIPSGKSVVISTADAVAKTISISGTVTMSSARKLTVSGNFTVSGGSFVAGDGTVAFNSTATVSGTVSFFNVELSAGVNFGTASTIGNGTSGSLTLNNGGFVTTNAPTYANNSTLVYNTGTNPYNRGDEWAAGASGQGVPFHVEIRTNTLLNLEVGASGTRERRCRGNLSIVGSNSALQMGSGNIDDLYVGGDVNINSTGGLLALGAWSNAAAGDIFVSGDWNHTLGDFQANERAVWFIGSSNNQNVNCTPNSGKEIFGYYIINKSNNGTVFMNCDAEIRGGNDGSPLQLLNGILDLKGKTITYYNFYDGTPHYVTVGGTAGNLIRQVISSSGTGVFNFLHNETTTKIDTIFRAFAGAELSFEDNVEVRISRLNSGTSGVNFGDGTTVVPKEGQNRTMALTTIKGTLRIDAGGFVNTEPPTYATGSLLKYNTGGLYNRTAEWKSGSGRGYPFNVQTSLAGTQLVTGGTSNTALVLNLAGSLTIDASTTFDMSNGGTNNMTVPLTVALDITNAGTLIASGSPGGDVILGRTWTRNTGGLFTHNTRSVTFNSSNLSVINGPSAATTESFYNLIISKAAAANTVTLASPVEVSNALTLNTGIVVTRANPLPAGYTSPTFLLTLLDNATSTTGSAASFVSGPMKKIGNDAFTFPVGKYINGEFHWRTIGISAQPNVAEEITTEFWRDNAYNRGSISPAAKASSPGLSHISMCEYWDLTKTTATLDVNVTLSWSNNPLGKSNCNVTNPNLVYVDNLSELVVVPYFNGMWGDQNSAYFGQTSAPGPAIPVSPALGFITWNGGAGLIDTYLKFTLGSTNWRYNPLPFTLVEFDGKKQSDDVLLTWKVAGNREQQEYTLEHSNDGVHFKKIAVIPATTDADQASYSFLHTQPSGGMNFYRLVAKSRMNQLQTSRTIKIWFDNKKGKVGIYPNPIINNQINIYPNGLSKGTYNIQLVGIDGKLLVQQPWSHNGMQQVYQLPLNATLPHGMYWLTITGNQAEPVRIKIIK